MKLISATIALGAVLIVLGVGYLYSFPLDAVDEAITLETVAQNEKPSPVVVDDEVDLGKLFAELLPGVDSLPEKEATAQSVGWTWEIPLHLNVKTSN